MTDISDLIRGLNDMTDRVTENRTERDRVLKEEDDDNDNDTMS